MRLDAFRVTEYHPGTVNVEVERLCFADLVDFNYFLM